MVIIARARTRSYSERPKLSQAAKICSASSGEYGMRSSSGWGSLGLLILKEGLASIHLRSRQNRKNCRMTSNSFDQVRALILRVWRKPSSFSNVNSSTHETSISEANFMSTRVTRSYFRLVE
jgi:hypothetical protein